MTTVGAGTHAARLTQEARRARARSVDALVLLSLLGAVAPVVVAAIARIAAHWQPGGDEAAIARISHDVFSANTPLLGMPSTISSGVKVTGGGTAHHLGPMLFWWFAIPDLVGRSSPNALVVAIALLDVVCIVGIAWALRQHAGPIGAVVAMIAISIMFIAIGRDVTVQIWNPFAALMPFLLFLVLAWAFASGDRFALPLAAVAGSFTMQCHVLYVIPVVSVTIAALVLLFLSDRATKGRDDRDRNARRCSWIATAVVLALCWWTAVWDQLFHHGGNVTRLWNSLSRSSESPLGFVDASHYLTHALAIPPLFARHFTSASAIGGLLGPVAWWTALTAVIVLIALVACTAKLRSDAPKLTGLGVMAVVALASAWYVLARLPIEFGGPTPYRLRFVWIVSVFAWIAVALVVGRALVRVRTVEVPASARRAIGALVVTAIVAGGAAASLRRSPAFAVAFDDTRAVTVLSSQLRASLPDRGPYLLQLGGSGQAFTSTGFGIMWDLVRRGYDIRVLAGDPYLGAHHGVPRRAHMRRLLIVSNDGRQPTAPDAQRVAYDNTAPSLPHEVARLRRQLIARLTDTPPRLTASGRAALDHNPDSRLRKALRAFASSSSDWSRVLDEQTLVTFAKEGWIQPAPALVRLTQRYESLRGQQGDSVFAAYVLPAPS